MTDDEKARVLAFLGYGCAEKARFAFFGIEEHTPPGSEIENLKLRLGHFQHPWEDKNVALEVLCEGFRDVPRIATVFAAALDPGSVRVWEWAAKVIAALRVPKGCGATEPWRQTWADEYRRLGTFGSDSSLVELYPLPKSGVTAWPKSYATEFGYEGFHDYYQGLFPRAQQSHRRSLLLSQVIGKLPEHVVIICYGRGGRGAEFWQRYDDLLAPVLSSLRGVRQRWHSVDANRIQVGISKRGHAIARVGFPYGRTNGNPVTDDHVAPLVSALRELNL